MRNIGADLRLARERSGLSLHDLSARTKIREPILESIERDDFSRLPSGLLTRGYLRAYAREVRLDPETIVQRYKNEFEAAALPQGLPLPSSRTEEENLGVSGRGKWWMAAAAVATVAALFLYAKGRPGAAAAPESTAVAVTGSDDLNAASIASQSPSVAGGVSVAAPEAPVASDANPAGPIEIAIHPTGVVWVQATSDGQRVLYSLLYPGQRTLIQAKQGLVLRVGDAGAVQYSIDGVPGRRLGGPGQVREVQITRDNRASFQDLSAP